MTDAQEVAERLAQLRRLRGVRERRDIEAGEIAEAIGVSAAAYSRYEKGERVPKEPYLGRLAAFYEVSRAFIRYGEGARPGPLGLDWVPVDSATVEAAKRSVAETSKKPARPADPSESTKRK